MTFKFQNSIVTCADAMCQEINVNGKIWKFDYSEMLGPLWLKKDGTTERKCQDPKKDVWLAFEAWLRKYKSGKGAPKDKLAWKRKMARRIRKVAADMHTLGGSMEYFGGFGDLGVHGRQMIGAAKMALGWANDLEGKGKKSLHLSAIPARKVAV